MTYQLQSCTAPNTIVGSPEAAVLAGFTGLGGEVTWLRAPYCDYY